MATFQSLAAMADAKPAVNVNDSVLLVALTYLFVDLLFEWAKFERCKQPINVWLLVSYGAVLFFRLTHMVGAYFSDCTGRDVFLLHLRQKSKVSWLITNFTWAIALPFYGTWTAMGTSWLWTVQKESPQCLPPGQGWWFIVLWLAVSYMWVFVHLFFTVMAWVLEFRLRKQEKRLAQIEDDDVTFRWGHVRSSHTSGYSALAGDLDVGLTVDEITSLPLDICTSAGHECSICLCDINEGEKIRKLGACGHTFHRSCIDLWFLRRADCPLCKCEVKPVIT